MNKLIELLEAAAGPSRGLDVDIFSKVLEGAVAAEMRGSRDFVKAQGILLETFMSTIGMKDVPEYTSSMDAALLLVPEGQDWSMSFWPPSEGTVTTPAIALCIAALKAHNSGPFDAYQWLRPSEQAGA